MKLLSQQLYVIVRMFDRKIVLIASCSVLLYGCVIMHIDASTDDVHKDGMAQNKCFNPLLHPQCQPRNPLKPIFSQMYWFQHEDVLILEGPGMLG